MKLTAPQQQISDSKARFRVASCGRRFGKSYLAMNEMAKFARFPNQRILAVAPTYKQCKNIWWNDLKGMLLERKWVKKINESELQITLVNGSTIVLRSSENFDALRGGKYNLIICDEFADMKPEAWYEVLRPTLSDTKGHALFIGSPKGRNHFYELWSSAEHTEDWARWQFTTLDGMQVDAEEIQAARRDLDERQFDQEYLAQFVSYSSVIFYGFGSDNVRVAPVLPTDRTPLHIGVDFNVDPMSAVICQKDANSIHVFDEIEIYGSNSLELVKEIRSRYGNNRQMFVYPDASGAKRTTNSPGLTDHLVFSNNGFILKVDPTNPPVAEAIGVVNSLLRSASGEVKLTIDPKCKKLIECMNKFTYKEGTRIPDKGIWDHMPDALRYVCYKLFPPKQTHASHSPRYLHTGPGR
jgi:hypothetical protein